MSGKHGCGGWLVGLILKLIVLAAALFAVALGIIYLMEKNPPRWTGNNDAVVVLGAQVYPDGRPSPQLELRLEAALNAYQAHPVPVIVCGAQGKNEPAPEGQIMRDWLIQKGVPSRDVTAECDSMDTRQNLQNAARLLPPGAQSITIVTSDYHLPRAMQLARDLGLSADGIGSPCKPEYWVKNHFREVLAWGKYFAVRLGILR